MDLNFNSLKFLHDVIDEANFYAANLILYLLNKPQPTFCPLQKKQIYNFIQEDGEILLHAWERFTKLVLGYPHHGWAKKELVEIFYGGVHQEDQEIIGHMGPTKAWDYLESLKEIEQAKAETSNGALEQNFEEDETLFDLGELTVDVPTQSWKEEVQLLIEE